MYQQYFDTKNFKKNKSLLSHLPELYQDVPRCPPQDHLNYKPEKQRENIICDIVVVLDSNGRKRSFSTYK